MPAKFYRLPQRCAAISIICEGISDAMRIFDVSFKLCFCFQNFHTFASLAPVSKEKDKLKYMKNIEYIKKVFLRFTYFQIF